MSLESSELTRRLGIKGGAQLPLMGSFQPVIIAADMTGLASPPVEARGMVGAQRTPVAGSHAVVAVTCRAPGNTLIDSLTVLTNTIQNRFFLTSVAASFVPAGGSLAVSTLEIGGSPLVNAADVATISAAQLAAFTNLAEIPFGTSNQFTSVQGLRYIVPAGRVFLVIGAVSAVLQSAVTWREFQKVSNPA